MNKLIMKSKFIEYMVKNKYTEGNNYWVSSNIIERAVGLTSYDIKKLAEYNPDYIETDNDVCYRITKKHKKDFPEYYL